LNALDGNIAKHKLIEYPFYHPEQLDEYNENHINNYMVYIEEDNATSNTMEWAAYVDKRVAKETNEHYLTNDPSKHGVPRKRRHDIRCAPSKMEKDPSENDKKGGLYSIAANIIVLLELTASVIINVYNPSNNVWSGCTSNPNGIFNSYT